MCIILLFGYLQLHTGSANDGQRQIEAALIASLLSWQSKMFFFMWKSNKWRTKHQRRQKPTLQHRALGQLYHPFNLFAQCRFPRSWHHRRPQGCLFVSHDNISWGGDITCSNGTRRTCAQGPATSPDYSFAYICAVRARM